MSLETQEQTGTDEMMTKPLPEHAWLQKLVGEWTTETEMIMGPDQPKQYAKGTESVKNLGGLWAYGEGKTEMPDGDPMTYYVGLGFDVTFKEYRGFMMLSVSSHLWKYTGSLSADGKTMTLSCEGPNMMGEGTRNYHDVITLIDDTHRTLTSSYQDDNGQYQVMMTCKYTKK